MSDLGQEQKNILTWWYQHLSDNTYSPTESYRKYVEDTEYEGSHETFNNLLLRLHKKGLLNKPKYGRYEFSQKGQNKADYILNPEKYDNLEEESLPLRDELIDFFIDFKEDEFRDSTANHEEFVLKISDLDRFDPDIVDQLELKPLEVLDAINIAAEDASEVDYTPPIRMEFDVGHFDTEIYKARSGSNIDKLVTVEGTIETASKIHNVCVQIDFVCQECKQRIQKKQEGQKKSKPYQCDCGSKRFKKTKEHYHDRLQFTVGVQKEYNQDIECVFETTEIDERAKKVFKPGNKVRVSGKFRVESRSKSANRFGEAVIDVIGFTQLNKTKELEEFDDEKIDEVKQKVEHRSHPFEDFSLSLAPEIVDSDMVKKMVASSLFGGSSAKDDGRIHSLILSNPGMGKSDILEFVKETFPNSHYSDGQAASAVGLTATVEQEKGGVWRLKAGKLVYADKGILSIDEFDKMNEEDAVRLNTAMAKPTFPIDKAGVNAELPGQASIIATGNFEEYLDEDSVKYIREYIPDHAESLMDRFSLVYAMKRDSESDDELVEDAILDSFSDNPEVVQEPVFSPEELVIYRELAIQHSPVLSQVSREFIKDWLKSQKTIGEGKENNSFNKDSNRYLVSLAKLTTMFARARFAERTDERDAQRAIKLMMACRESRGLGDGESDRVELKGERRRKQLQMVEEKIQEMCERRDDTLKVSELAEELPFDESQVPELVKELDESVYYQPKKDEISVL